MKLREATIEDAGILLEWRNDPETRKNSDTVEKVLPEDHLAWLMSVLEDTRRQLFMAVEGNFAFGTISADYNEATQAHHISMTIDPALRRRGYGKDMLGLLVQKINTRLEGEVKKQNVVSVKVIESVGFQKVDEKDGILYYARPAQPQ